MVVPQERRRKAVAPQGRPAARACPAPAGIGAWGQMKGCEMDLKTLKELFRYQSWADAEHWRAFRENPALLVDEEIRKRLNHTVKASEMLCALARGEAPNMAGWKDSESAEALESALQRAGQIMEATLGSVDTEKIVAVPRGPKGPFESPAGVLLLQALMHGQHHRGQNASRMRQLGVTPPMTDLIIWHALGQP